MTDNSVFISFEDLKVLPQLLGEGDRNLSELEKAFDITTSCRGNKIMLKGEAENISACKAILGKIYAKLEKGDDVTYGGVDALIRTMRENMQQLEQENAMSDSDIENKPKTMWGGLVSGLEGASIVTTRKTITPYSETQAHYMDALMSKEVVFASGPAGTGKTYIAVAAAVAKFIDGTVDRIILSRPAVEAGERLGFLPGDMRDKVDPYLRPLYDALYDMLPAERVVKAVENGEIEIAPLAFMRGRTLRNAYVILDEAQNATAVQMKMFLTRLGRGSHMVITGDLSQTDLPSGTKSGFGDAINKLQEIEEVCVINFKDKDIVRHHLTMKIVQAYEKHEKKT